MPGTNLRAAPDGLLLKGRRCQREYYPPIMENQMEKKMENEMETLVPCKRVYRDITPIMENQMEKKMENEMEIG